MKEGRKEERNEKVRRNEEGYDIVMVNYFTIYLENQIYRELLTNISTVCLQQDTINW
jgi:hypothetical protein